jgi:hypothetical protein
LDFRFFVRFVLLASFVATGFSPFNDRNAEVIAPITGGPVGAPR